MALIGKRGKCINHDRFFSILCCPSRLAKMAQAFVPFSSVSVFPFRGILANVFPPFFLSVRLALAARICWKVREVFRFCSKRD